MVVQPDTHTWDKFTAVDNLLKKLTVQTTTTNTLLRELINLQKASSQRVTTPIINLPEGLKLETKFNQNPVDVLEELVRQDYGKKDGVKKLVVQGGATIESNTYSTSSPKSVDPLSGATFDKDYRYIMTKLWVRRSYSDADTTIISGLRWVINDVPEIPSQLSYILAPENTPYPLASQPYLTFQRDYDERSIDCYVEYAANTKIRVQGYWSSTGSSKSCYHIYHFTLYRLRSDHWYFDR
jgi:hypothetical protein